MFRSAAALRVHPADDLVVALRDLAAGEAVEVGGERFVLAGPVAQKHKFAARDFAEGDLATMYGVTVGRATKAIARGGAVTTGNLAHAAAEYGGRSGDFRWTPPDASRFAGRTFDGIPRADGRVGTANHWVVIPLVFCEERNLRAMRESLESTLGYAKLTRYQRFAAQLADRHRAGLSLDDLAVEAEPPAPPRLFPNVDGIKFLSHGAGCGEMRIDSHALCALLAGYVCHPNVAGATVLSLGCQHAQVSILMEEIAKRSPDHGKPVLVFEQQRSESERAMLERAIKDTFRGIAAANDLKRTPAPLSKLLLGMECGGSDGFSGISANPAMGRAADLLVALGGGVILSEFPELNGVEQELVNRCASDAVAAEFARIMRAYSARAEALGEGFYNNPSPGNIADGLITDAIKSAGAAKKGGTSPVADVLDYPGWATKPGLTLLCTPGNDVESTTAMAGAGANLMMFSTGLGTPTGNPVAPVIKVASNTELADRLPDIIDFNAGPIIRGEASIDEMGDQLLELAIAVASGKTVPKAVALGQEDFLPWRRGLSL
ncbi:MAG: altronate dehydratase family protein [Verrucomicrobiales bacterium]